MTTVEPKERIAKIIDQLRNGETTSNLAEEIQKSIDEIGEKFDKEANTNSKRNIHCQ